jgi:hypothetical protein
LSLVGKRVSISIGEIRRQELPEFRRIEVKKNIGLQLASKNS